MSVSPAVSLPGAIADLDELVDHITRCRQRTAAAFAAEMFFFDRVAGLVQQRERERGARVGAITASSELGLREVYAELAAALRLSEWQVARKVSLAWVLNNEFRETLCDASCGQISPEHATLIAETGIQIQDATVRREYEAVALDMAVEMTPGQLKPALDGLVVRLDPEGTQQRVHEAVQRRKVTVRQLEPGITRLTVDVPTAQGVGAYNRIHDIATELCEQNAAEKAEAEAAEKSGTTDTVTGAAEKAGAAEKTGAVDDGSADMDATGETPVFDERTHAQIMADVVCDLLLTGAPDGHGTTEQAKDALGAITATVQVTVPATALAGQTVGGATVAGFGPIDDDTAKHLAAAAPTWVRVFTDPCTGVPVSIDRYRPNTGQRLFLQVRDQQCRFPGCRRPAQRCDIDHTVAYADGGPTCLCNLEHLCERHHTLKHETDWAVQQLPGGILRWTAPTGRVHHTRPPGTVRFEPVALIPPNAKHPHPVRSRFDGDSVPPF
ncbi:HNH endonuclease signature motif containing protein [Microbacterium luticocti]|uniref:HNH endonuclease signature motif containing protein n=1 Tax=Microbacterium luticocti TaxID=451764 RepID=UPI0012ECB143|nr:HNH endonuclease signature motif containing protein [Microbacterium luticocti]